LLEVSGTPTAPDGVLAAGSGLPRKQLAARSLEGITGLDSALSARIEHSYLGRCRIGVSIFGTTLARTGIYGSGIAWQMVESVPQ